MFEHANEHEIVARFAQADGRLMQALATSHGLEFAAAFRIDHANEVAKAIFAIVRQSADEPADIPPSQFGDAPETGESSPHAPRHGMALLLRILWQLQAMAPSLVTAFLPYLLSLSDGKARERAGRGHHRLVPKPPFAGIRALSSLDRPCDQAHGRRFRRRDR